MQTLTYGFKKPQTNDSGSSFFPALESNIQQLNDHDHNGVNSAKLAAGAVEATFHDLGSTWVAGPSASKPYKQLVTLPTALISAAMKTDLLDMAFRDADGNKLYLDMTVITDTTYEVYSNDNTLDLTVVYIV